MPEHILDPGHDTDRPTFEGLRDVEVDLARPLTRENFVVTAQEVTDSIRAVRDEGRPLREGLTEARKVAVDESPHPQLALLAEIMLLAPQMARVDDQINRHALDENERREGLLSMIRYNHAVRDLIFANPQTFTHSDLENWLGAVGHNEKFAQRVVQGVGAEVAIARQAARTPGVHEVQLSTVTQDSRGGDLYLAAVDQPTRSVSVKSGWAADRQVVRQQSGKLEIGLPTNAIDEYFDVMPLSGRELSSQLQEALGVQVTGHVPF
jgi:hypothetical protein